MAKRTHDLAGLGWKLAGFVPNDWLERSIDDFQMRADVAPVPAKVPGSVQNALRDAGVLPDWTEGLNARACEWVENRHWIFYADLPDSWLSRGAGSPNGGDASRIRTRLRCDGLDYEGMIRVNGWAAGTFRGSFVPHVFDLSPYLKPTGNTLEIIFTEPPRWLGQMGFTSRMTEWKTRFNYTWDWTSRLVQLGVTGAITLETSDGPELGAVTCRAMVEGDASHPVGTLRIAAEVLGDKLDGMTINATLADRDGAVVEDASVLCAGFAAEGLRWDLLPIELWWPNGMGPQKLYRLVIRMLDADGVEIDRVSRSVGFRTIEWRACDGAPNTAEPWICAVNDRLVFLQGVNWTPVRPNYADVTPEQVRERVELYRDLGCNLLRVWGGATLETEPFYDCCDEMGLLVWQEFPLSSSGLDNWPPEDETAIREMSDIARTYVMRRHHHPSLIVWCGGNELQGGPDGSKEGVGKPVDRSHPMIAALADVVTRLDPGRRFLPTSSSGPRFGADPAEFGMGVHHDVHGPWLLPEGTLDGAARYWEADDALFRSEVGVPGASPADIIGEFSGGLPAMPASADNPLWRRTLWWIQWPEFLEEHGREPVDLDEFVAWSQNRQANGLVLAAKSCKGRFPSCGGFIVWMGHDCFPCTANTAIVDYHGRPKPAALALKEVFMTEPCAPGSR